MTIPAPTEWPVEPVASVEPAVPAEKPRRRPIAGWLGFALVLAGFLVVGGATISGYLQTRDAFIPGPPWFTVAASIATVPLAVLGFLGLLLGIVGVSRREKPGWPAVMAMVLAFPALGAAVFGAFVIATVTIACAGPAGACY